MKLQKIYSCGKVLNAALYNMLVELDPIIFTGCENEFKENRDWWVIFENIIKARARGIEIIGEKRIIKMNSLNGIHGHEYIGGISAPVNIARGLYLKGKVSAFQGHNHASSSHSECDMNGKVVTTYSIACLCELHPAYMPLNKWQHGFAEVDLDSNGNDYDFRNHQIIKGKVF